MNKYTFISVDNDIYTDICEILPKYCTYYIPLSHRKQLSHYGKGSTCQPPLYERLFPLSGVVDRSVEILSRGKTGSLSTAAVFQLLKATEPYKWLGSQIEDYAYCSGHSTVTFFDEEFAYDGEFSDVVECLFRKLDAAFKYRI